MEKFEQFKQHLKEHKSDYLMAAGFATITCLIMRSVASPQSISHGISVTAQDGISVLGNKNVLNNVSLISVHRQGPPSWVIRCLETNEVFESQSAAAAAMNLPAPEISKHLNGVMDHVRGNHFERIAMAAV